MTVQSGINFESNTSGNKFDSKIEGRRGWFKIFHVKVAKKLISILRLGKKNYFIGLQYVKANEIL
jgi:hypothetical protein